MEPALNETAYYQQQQQAINSYELPKDIKPCIAILLTSANIEGQGYRRTEYGLMIAAELRDLKQDREQIQEKISKWNYDYVNPPLKQKDTEGILKQCFKTKPNGKYVYNYNYCSGKYAEGLLSEGHCIGREYCYYYRQHKGKKIRSYDYIAKGWQHILTAREQILLFAIQRLEKMKQIGRDKNLITGYRELSHQTGTNKRYIKQDLIALEAYGLITLEIGKPQLWDHTGTRIKRVIPPKIPKRFIGDPKAFKAHVKQSIKALTVKKKLTIQA